MFRIENDDLGSRNICKSGHCRFTCISGSSGKNNNLIFYLILLSSCSHKMWKN